MAALRNGVMNVLDTALSPSPSSSSSSLLQSVTEAVAAFVERDVPTRNARLVEGAVQTLLGFAQEEEGQKPFTVITLSLSSTLMAVFEGLHKHLQQQQQGRRRRLHVVSLWI